MKTKKKKASKKDLKTIINENALLYQQIILLSGQLAPIMDRIGRLYTDFSPHLLSNVNSFNSDMRNREHRTNRNRRNRRHHNRENRRERSEENSRRSDEELDDNINNSSDSLSRDSNDSNSRGNDRNDQNGNNEIRSRLRSISNTISRIRSSISSMRTLIFNNLGRGDRTEDNPQNRFGIDERGERQIIVNPQVPIISSPGDIASVHNIFDRFIDRQMINIIGGDGNQNNRANRNNQNSNPNTQANANEVFERPNNEPEISSNNSNNRNRRPDANPQRQNDFLSQLVGEGGPLGSLLNSEFGGNGFGGGSDTIEFHIHAFVPSGNRDENPIQRNISNIINAQSSNENSNSRNESSNLEEHNTDININNNIEQNNDRRYNLSIQAKSNIYRLRIIQESNGSLNSEVNIARSIIREDREVQTIEVRSRRGRRSRNRERDDKELSCQSVNSSMNLGYRNNSPSSFIRREIDENEALKQEVWWQTEIQTHDIHIQNTINMYEKWTQTKDLAPQIINERVVAMNPTIQGSEMQTEQPSIKNRGSLRDTSSRLKKK